MTRQIKLTKAEKKAIEDLEKLAETWPKSLMLFSNSGSLYVLKVPRDQEVSMEFEVTYIPYIPNDGGDMNSFSEDEEINTGAF